MKTRTEFETRLMNQKAFLVQALHVIAAMADEQRDYFNELWENVELWKPGQRWDHAASNVRGGYISISEKARAILAKVEENQ